MKMRKIEYYLDDTKFTLERELSGGVIVDINERDCPPIHFLLSKKEVEPFLKKLAEFTDLEVS